MFNNLTVKVGPQVYRYNVNAIDTIPEVLREYSAKKILIVHGTISWEKAKKKINFLNHNSFKFFYHQYTGVCSYDGATKIADKVELEGIDFIIGVGGGSLADLVGYSAHLANVSFGIIPTLASNCAPWTPLSVMYKENGESEGKTEHYLRQAAFLITDPELVIDAPVKYFVAGLADTIAKWYECESILDQAHLKDEPFLRLAGYTAKLSSEVIIEHSAQAIKDMKNKEVTHNFKVLSEIIFGVAGLVGGLGDKYARNAAAHAMHDALGKYIPASQKFLHGEKVAYGIFYQMALEQKWGEIDKLLPYYKELDLPLSLKQMEIYPEDEATLIKMVDFINSLEKVHLVPVPISKDILFKAIIDLENYIQN
ncbi:iron-containing alcohol dehydrogenase family protein [Facklamia sp. 7083-14-GEN3]|uniref:iron-containing alcohol dehydrogenase family protein n=1 Tax=Facklamia sp. 7083-14-GEN3 TaxID=2973478 RepID=UPI00215D13D9|nr:iron-containing alcohol dehydrogenase family protein [Facklamia sp. 7083-14-GEN3]MCR8969077.1 iron-containing alcohol dehydrogenase family protein [Facklamia sp. 7083-14-GEN3]